MNKFNQTLYRYEIHMNTEYILGGYDLICYEFEVVRETDCGYWVRDKTKPGQFTQSYLEGKEKWMNKFSMKFAQTTKESALLRFIKRKKYRLNILKNDLMRVELGIGAAKNLLKELENDKQEIKS